MSNIPLLSPIQCNPKALAIELQATYSGPQKIAGLNIKTHNITDPKDNHKMILRLGKPTADGFSEVGSDFSPEELFLVLKDTTYFNAIKDGLQGTRLELPDTITEENLKKIQQIQTDKNIRNQFNRDLESNMNPVGAVGKFNVNQTISIPMSAKGFTDSAHQRHIISSESANPCVILIAYNAETQTAGATHINPGTPLEEIDDILNLVGNDCEIHLTGGIELGQDVAWYLKSKHDLIPKTSNFVLKHEPDSFGKRLALDTKTGQVYDGFSQTFHLASDIQYANIGLFPGTPLRLAYDGRNITECVESHFEI